MVGSGAEHTGSGQVELHRYSEADVSVSGGEGGPNIIFKVEIFSQYLYTSGMHTPYTAQAHLQAISAGP